MSSSTVTDNEDSARGFAFALAAYSLWGFLPLYMKLLAHLPAVEVVAHRILWSIPIAGITLVSVGRTRDIRAALRSPKTLLLAVLTAAFISVNWGIYVWAIAVDRTVETALGYYINPLVSIAMGAILLGEKLSRTQIAAVGLAVAAVLVLSLRPAACRGSRWRSPSPSPSMVFCARRCRSARARVSSWRCLS